MLIHDVAQNSEEWERLRLGIPTSSEFHRIVCPKMGQQHVCPQCGVEFVRKRKKCPCGGEVISADVVKTSAQSEPFMFKLLAEWYHGAPLEDPESQFRTSWMERGHELEQQAVNSYEFEKGVDTHKVGFITDDAQLLGTSPDRLVGDDGILEIKCPSPAIHMGYMVNRSVDGDYWPQIQGQLLITGRKWVDIQSYCPSFPTVIVTVNRDEAYIEQMQEKLVEFIRTMMRRRFLIEQQYGLPQRTVAVPAEDPMGITADDLEHIVRERFPNSTADF